VGADDLGAHFLSGLPSNTRTVVAAEPFTLHAPGDRVVAIDFHNAYTRSKPSFMVPKRGEDVATATGTDGRWTLETGALRVEADAASIRIYRKADGAAPIAEFRDFSPDGATVMIDRGFAAYGLGGNNAWRFKEQNDIDELDDVDLNRWGHEYRVHHRYTGQGNNFFPWVLSGQGFGIFIDSSFPMTIDLRDRFVVGGKNIRTFYFIDGPDLAEAVRNYVRLTGLPPMHPAWALGFEQSTRSWMGHGELDFVTTYFREKRIPVDGFDLLTTYGGEGGIGRGARDFHAGYLDYYQGWHPLGSYKSYNPKLLPNGAADIRMLRDRGFRPIVHGYWVGDFSDEDENEKVWQDYKGMLADGWSGWWLDGTEYCDVGDGSSFDHSYEIEDSAKFTDEFRDEHDNVWALLRSKAFYERQRRDFPDQRVYILNRTVFPGVQAYATGVNQGDYWSSWKLMEVQTVWLLQMGMSGIFFPETDIGGHWPTGELTDELFIRWAFLGTFTPIMRSHGHNWRSRLPWGFGPENEARFVPLIKLRSAMFPYNYTLLAEANRTGLPMMRALVLEFPDDPIARKTWNAFMWGPSVLVAPIYTKGARAREVYLPAGTWVHHWTMDAYQGPTTVTIDAPLGKDPLFLRAGSIIPIRTPSDTIPSESDGSLTLLALPSDREGAFTLYDDDRETYRYERGEHSSQTFRISPLDASGSFRLDIGAVVGDHEGVLRVREYRIEVPMSLALPRRVSLAGRDVDFSERETGTAPYRVSLTDRTVFVFRSLEGPATLVFRAD
jgi:alpha-glucosidase (family GH31 glycosyl hydrolase)